MDKLTPKRGSAGGKARSDKLSKEQRSEIAKRAALSRWSKDIPKAEHAGIIEVNDLEIDCAVVEIDGTPNRLLSERSVTKALGGKRGGSHWRRMKENPDGAHLPVYLSANNLRPFISNELALALTSPIKYISTTGSKIGNGIPAEMLPKIMWVYQDAAKAGKLHPSQVPLADQARVILKALSGVAMVALVDEATGYQEKRAKDALARILEQYIAKEYQQWTKTFPERFYHEIFRLKGWEWTEKAIQGKRPSVVGKYTDDIVYERLAPSVLDELRSKNPVGNNGRRPRKHFQWLTGEVGHPRLLAHLEGVTLLMRQSKTWGELKDKLDEFYPIHRITELGIETHVRKKKIGSKA